VWFFADLPKFRDVGPNGRGGCKDLKGSIESFGGVVDLSAEDGHLVVVVPTDYRNGQTGVDPSQWLHVG
jgi:hypothetical protein